MVSEELLVLRAVADDVVKDAERSPHDMGKHLTQHNMTSCRSIARTLHGDVRDNGGVDSSYITQ